MEEKIMDDHLFCQVNGRIAIISGSLGHVYKGEYLIEPDCLEAVKDLIRLLKKDDKSHISRRCLGKTNIVKSHLVHIIRNCQSDMTDLFSITLRLLINLTTPALLLFDEEIPHDKVERHIYITLLDCDQRYKTAFVDVDFWNKICARLTNLFEIDWTERSADDEIEIQRIFTLLRNVLYIPSIVENEKKPDIDLSNHDKVIEALHHSHLVELLLIISSNVYEESHYLNLLEIFSLFLREQNPKTLAHSKIDKSSEEKVSDLNGMIRSKEIQNNIRRSYSNYRYFNSSFVMKGVKSVSNIDIVCHTSLEKLKHLNICQNQRRPIKNKIAAEIDNKERLSTFSCRLFLKEFCTKFLSCSFSNFMKVIKNRLDSGKSLANDQTYYFWALSFFLKFAIETRANIDLIKSCLTLDSFHFIQTNIDAAFEHLYIDKKKVVYWTKRIHIILKAYNSLLETLLFMDNYNPLIRALSREIKSELFYVIEYREMTLHLLLKYDSNKFPLSYLQDLVQSVHLFIKLLEEFSKEKKIVVQKVIKSRRKKTKERKNNQNESEDEIKNLEKKNEKWEQIKDNVYDMIVSSTNFPDIQPFDSTLDIPLDEEKKNAMKNIQKFLFQGKIEQSIGLLRSCREVWPEKNYFGFKGMTAEDETIVLQEICLADLGSLNESSKKSQNCNTEEHELDFENERGENFNKIIEHDFDVLSYKKRFVHKKVVESCGILLKYYKKNSSYINHCALKLLHRICWECCMPAMLYQASLLWTLLGIMNDPCGDYNEINTFTVNLLRKFQKDATKTKLIFLELLFWKDHSSAIAIQHGYNPYSIEKPKKAFIKKKRKDTTDNITTDKKIKIVKKDFKKIDEEIEGIHIKHKKDIAEFHSEVKNMTRVKEICRSKKKKGTDYLEDIDNSDCHASSHNFKKKIKPQILPYSSEEDEISESTSTGTNLKSLTNITKKTFEICDVELLERDDFQEFDFLKTKRQKFIDSDSDDEEAIVSRNYKKKKVVIDSESDVDDFEVDSKNE